MSRINNENLSLGNTKVNSKNLSLGSAKINSLSMIFGTAKINAGNLVSIFTNIPSILCSSSVKTSSSRLCSGL